MKKKTVLYVLILIIGISGYIVLHNDFIILKNENAISNNIEESKARGTYIKTFKIINIENLNGYSEFPIESVWMEYSWHWNTDRYIFQEVIIDTFMSKHIIFDIKNNNKYFPKEDYLKNWIIENSNNLFAGIYQNTITTSENENKSYMIYKTKNDYKFMNNCLTPCFKFEISMD